MKKLFAKEKIWRAFLIYTIIFGLLSITIYLCFDYGGRTFVSSVDGINQHLVTLKTWRSLLINFFHTGQFNTFTWNLGNGIDLFADFGYYIIGDFVSYLSILCPESKLYYFYVIAIFLRLYFSGISFIIYSKYKKYNNYATIIGAICYSFMIFSLFATFRHPYFANAFAIFPLLMIGMDKIVLENKKTFYIFIIFISYLSSFYFAYIMSFCLLIYGTILIISTYKKEGFKRIIKEFFKVFICSLIGIALSSFVLIPILNQFLHSNRDTNLSIFDYRYGYEFLSSLTRSLASFSANQWGALGINAIVFVALPIAIKNYKKNFQLLLFALILLITLLFPFISSIISGFSFPTNRHTFVIPFIMSILIMEFLNNYNELNKKDIIIIVLFNLIYYIIAFHFGDLNKVIVLTIMCTVLLTLIFLYKKNINNFFNKYQLLKQYNCFNILITIIVVGITANYVTLFYDYNNYLDEFIGSGKIKNIYDTNYNTTPLFSSKITEIVDQDKDYYKIGKTQSSIQNDALYLGYNSTDYYYSIVPNIIQQLGYDLSNFSYYTSSEIKQLDYRTRINTLLGKKYYVMEDDKNLPYGYEIIEEDKSNIYQNKYYVPFAQYYDKYITNEEYEKLSNIEKENSLLNNVVLDKTNNNVLTHNDNYQEEIDKNIKPLLFTMTDYNKKIVVTNNEENDKKNNEIEITIDPNQEFHGEIYLKINNLNYQPYTKSELYDLKTNKDKYSKRGFNKKYEHYEERYSYNLEIDFNEETYEKPTRDNRYDSYSSGSNNVLLNLGYFDNLADLEDNKITLTLSALGTYTYDNLEVLLVTFDDYEEDVANLNKSNYETIEYKNGYMKGTVDLEEPGIIQFATAYVDGWDLYIDGKKSEILNVNKYFLGTYMDKGKHTIELKYHTPLIKEGTIISLISLIIYIIVIIFDYRKNKVDLKK